MTAGFRDRREAGRALAERLAPLAGHPDVLVLGLPRGGVPVAAEVAQTLGAPLDVLVVRKLGVPGHEELAMGAIATGGPEGTVRVLNTDVIEALHVPRAVVERVTKEERRELERREHAYRGDRPPLEVRGKTVVLVDDGLATGSTMLAAVAALRRLEPSRIVAAAPVGAMQSCVALRREADACTCVIETPALDGVGRWYGDFSQTTDAEVRALLAAGGAARVPGPTA